MASLVFYAAIFNGLFALILLFFKNTTLPPINTVPILCALGFINLAYLYPYYKGLKYDDTSTAVSFFGLGRIFIPILAYFIVGEILLPKQYVGMALIIVGSISLGLKRQSAKLIFSKAFWYIAIAAFLISFEAVLFKYLFDRGLSVGTVLAGQMFTTFIFSMLMLVSRRLRRGIRADVPILKRSFSLMTTEEALTFAAILTEAYAIDSAPVSIVKSLSLLIPFFVLLYAKVFKRFLPHWFAEEVDFGSMTKKALLFGLMLIGALLVAT